MATRRDDVLPITMETTLRNAKKWLNIIRYRESGSIIQLQDDCEYRVLEIITNKKILKNILGPYFKRYLLTYVAIDNKELLPTIKNSLIELCLNNTIPLPDHLETASISSLLEHIGERGYDVGLFVSHISPLLQQKNFQPLFDLEFIIRTSKNLSVICFSEIDITHDRYNILTDKCSALFDNIIKYPLYSEADSKQFIDYYNTVWNFTLSKQAIDAIIASCSGYLWLIHQAQRTIRNNPEISVIDAVSDELMLKKLQVIWDKCTDNEKKIIQNVLAKNLTESDKVSHEYKYLLDIHVIKELDQKTVLGIPLFSLIIEKEKNINQLQVEKNRISIGKVDITSELTKNEKAFLVALLSERKRLITRDSMAKAIWGNTWEDQYSDWAMDRLAYRVRTKLNALGFNAKLIKTIKKKGFSLGYL